MGSAGGGGGSFLLRMAKTNVMLEEYTIIVGAIPFLSGLFFVGDFPGGISKKGDGRRLRLQRRSHDDREDDDDQAAVRVSSRRMIIKSLVLPIHCVLSWFERGIMWTLLICMGNYTLHYNIVGSVPFYLYMLYIFEEGLNVKSEKRYLRYDDHGSS